MRNLTLLASGVLLAAACPVSAGPILVEQGQPRAEIVIAADASRTTLLAADELRDNIEKISGAVLPIVTTPGAMSVRVYVGRSEHTDGLGVTGEGLKHGAYRMVSGDDWLVLLGEDTEFVPVEPWPRSNSQIVDGSVQKAWNEITGKHWGYPLGGLRKYYSGRVGAFGTPEEQERNENGEVNVWGFDERGSFNAVCGFLRKLGARWYMPGELGEVLPDMTTIEIPALDETVIPDFEVRRFNVRFGTSSRDTAMWAMRLGMRDPYGLMVAHGMHTMTQTAEILENHPEWFALYGGKRDNQPGVRLNHLCYSNPELFEETVQWARAQFDHFGLDTVSVMPPDAYISICQCPLCEGKDEPERGSRGKLSNHVWDFTNRVAREVATTHPDKHIVCCAYGANTDPPTNIGKLEPNVQVVIVGGRRPRSTLPEQQEEVRALRSGWLEKTDNPIVIFENYPITDRGWYLPAYVARTIGESINETKGVSKGEDIWLSFGPKFDTEDIGFNHFQVYFTARMYWGGPEQDPMAMLDEYCRLFYGPSAGEMKDFFVFCEDRWQEMETDKDTVDSALSKFSAALAKAEPGSVYARRLALVDEFLDSLRSRSEQLGKERGPVPTIRLLTDAVAGDIVIDGIADEEFWQELPVASTGRFRELQTGREPVCGTSFRCAWGGGNVWLAIRCEDLPGQPLNVGTTRNDDASLWYGDALEILLETDSHSYYQIAVNPAGALVDLDRGVEKDSWYRWESQAEVAALAEDGAWTVEIRIPVTEDENDPLNQVVGRKPIQSLPWHINLCRQRVRENGTEYSAFSPTGAGTFHEPMKFGRFYDGRSHAFPSLEPEQDYIRDSRAALDLSRKNGEQGLASFLAIAEREGLTDFQRSDALDQAARVARAMKDYERADALAARIPLSAVADTARMETLFAQRRIAELLEAYGEVDADTWPFWQAGSAASIRGRAFAAEGMGERAEEDLSFALPLTPDPVARLAVSRALAENRAGNLGDTEGALAAYREMLETTRATGSSEYYYGVLGAARLHQEKGEFEAGLACLDRVEHGKLRGSWLGSFLLARADAYAAAGKTDDARREYEGVLSGDTIEAHRKTATERLAALKD